MLQLNVRHGLTLAHPPQSQGFGLAVMKNRPVPVLGKKTVQPLPATRLTVMLQHKDRVITRLIQIPTTVTAARYTNKAVQKIMASVRIRFDVVEKNPRCLDQFRQSRAFCETGHEVVPLGSGLQDESPSHLAVLIAEPLHARCELIGIGCRKVRQALNAQLDQHFPSLRANSTDFTEMALR